MKIAQSSEAPRPTLLLLIPHLRGGGAEQVMRLLAQQLPARKYNLHLASVTESRIESPVLPGRVPVTNLGENRVRSSAIPILRLVWRLRPAVILSGMAHLNFLLLLLRPLFPRGTKLLVRQNATISLTVASHALPRYTPLLYRLLYRRADRVICQSKAMARDLIEVTGIPAELVAVLPNPVDVEGIRAGRKNPIPWDGPGPHLLAVGRLSREKGFDLLVRALFMVRGLYPTASLTILGAGREEQALKLECRMLGLEDAVVFPGYVESPYAYFPGADLFVLSSRYEGMPNALLEAAAAGLPIVAFPASGGIVDFLRDRPQTWITERHSAPALAASISKALLILAREKRMQGEIPRFPGPANPTPPAVSTSTL